MFFGKQSQFLWEEARSCLFYSLLPPLEKPLSQGSGTGKWYMDSDVLLSELYPTLGTEQEAEVGAVASGLLDVEPLSHELG